jgi:hypothetical protein
MLLGGDIALNNTDLSLARSLGVASLLITLINEKHRPGSNNRPK